MNSADRKIWFSLLKRFVEVRKIYEEVHDSFSEPRFFEDEYTDEFDSMERIFDLCDIKLKNANDIFHQTDTENVDSMVKSLNEIDGAVDNVIKHLKKIHRILSGLSEDCNSSIIHMFEETEIFKEFKAFRDSIESTTNRLSHNVF